MEQKAILKTVIKFGLPLSVGNFMSAKRRLAPHEICSIEVKLFCGRDTGVLRANKFGALLCGIGNSK